MWFIGGPIVAFLDCYAPCVRAHFRCARARRTLGYARRSLMTPSRCGRWQKGIRCGVPGVSLVSIKIPCVTGWIALGGIVELSLPLFDALPITECQVDALWSFVRK